MKTPVGLKDHQRVLMWRATPPAFIRCRTRYLPAKGRATESYLAYAIDGHTFVDPHPTRLNMLYTMPFVELCAHDEGITWARGWRSGSALALRAHRALVA